MWPIRRRPHHQPACLASTRGHDQLVGVRRHSPYAPPLTLTEQKRGGRSLPSFHRTGAGSPYYTIFTLAKMIAKVYSAIDSINTSAKIRANWMPGRAPGLRAKPSQAATVAFDWE